MNSGLGTHALNTGGPNSTVDPVDQQYVIKTANSCGGSENNTNSSFCCIIQQNNNAFYPAGMQSLSSHLQQNLSSVSLGNAIDPIAGAPSEPQNHLLKSNYHHSGGGAAMTATVVNHHNASSQSSFFLNTNASIFERNPFQDFTASKINALNTASGNGGVEQLLQVREDALKFIT